MRISLTILTAILLLGSLQGNAQTSYGYAPPPANIRLQEAGPYAYPAPPPRPEFRARRGIRIQRGISPQGYYLKIDTGDQGPESIQIEVRGREILIRRLESTQTEQQDKRGGYSFSRSSSSFRRRLSLPRDADPAQMSRSEEGGMITLTFPRHTNPERAYPGYDYGTGPYRP